MGPAVSHKFGHVNRGALPEAVHAFCILSSENPAEFSRDAVRSERSAMFRCSRKSELQRHGDSSQISPLRRPYKRPTQWRCRPRILGLRQRLYWTSVSFMGGMDIHSQPFKVRNVTRPLCSVARRLIHSLRRLDPMLPAPRRLSRQGAFLKVSGSRFDYEYSISGPL